MKKTQPRLGFREKVTTPETQLRRWHRSAGTRSHRRGHAGGGEQGNNGINTGHDSIIADKAYIGKYLPWKSLISKPKLAKIRS